MVKSRNTEIIFHWDYFSAKTVRCPTTSPDCLDRSRVSSRKKHADLGLLVSFGKDNSIQHSFKPKETKTLTQLLIMVDLLQTV